MKSKPKFKVGQIVVTRGSLILDFVPRYWKISRVANDRDGFIYAGVYEGKQGPSLGESGIRALTKREAGR